MEKGKKRGRKEEETREETRVDSGKKEKGRGDEKRNESRQWIKGETGRERRMKVTRHGRDHEGVKVSKNAISNACIRVEILALLLT